MHALPPSEPDDDSPSDAFARALEDYERSAPSASAAAGAAAEIAVGMKVRARVIAVGAAHTLVDFGGRSEGVVETRGYRNDDGSLRIAVGDELELFVVESGDQIVLAASIRTNARAALGQLRDAHASGVPVSGRVTGVNPGGLTVELGGARGFCPVSQIEAGFCADPSIYVGKTLEFAVTAIEEGRGSVVISRRALLRRAAEEQTRLLLASLQPGDEREGTVARLEPFGAFVDLGGVDGLVHVSEISHARVGHPKEALRAGEKVRVRVLRLDTGKDGRTRIALSIKAAGPDPWLGIEARFVPGMRVHGVVARLAEFGAFVTLAPGVDGLVHVSQIAAHRIGHAKDVLAVGQTVEAVVLAVEPGLRRISLSIRDALEPTPPPAAALSPAAAGAPAATPVAATPAPEPAPAAPPELTTMALALRKAKEKAQSKRGG